MDYTPNSRRLSEISHLFLSDVRKKQTGDSVRPARTPPGNFRGDVSIDLTPEEFAMTLQPSAPAAAFKPLRAVIAHHLGETMPARVRDLAAAMGMPIGVIYANDEHVRVCRIDTLCEVADEPAAEPMDLQRLREVIVELDEDVTQWLLVLPDPRSTDTQNILRTVADWTLLTAADHDGVVTAYRTLKSVCGDATPAISVGVFGAATVEESEKTVRKLAAVCGQFLTLTVNAGPAVLDAPGAAETCLLEALADDGTADSHWPVLAGLIDGAGKPSDMAAPAAIASTTNASAGITPVFASIPTEPAPAPIGATADALTAGVKPREPLTGFDMSELSKAAFEPQSPIAAATVPVSRGFTPAATASSLQSVSHSALSAPFMTIAADADDAQTILELPANDTSPAAVLRAVLAGGGAFVESPIKAPALPEAVVAVSRDRRLTLLVVAKPGLADLRSVAAALRWTSENRQLIAMAVPQLSIDAFAEPTLQLFVDHADATADALQPLLAAGSVTVAAYRKVRWAGRMGLLLDAA